MRSPSLRTLLSGLVILMASSNVWAHPGHGAIDASSPGHYLLSPEHSAPLVAVVAIAGALGWWVLRSQRKPR